LKILLVEDSKFLRISTERVLETAGYGVISAADGEEAIRLAREQCPALILLDVMLPKITGLEVLKTLKSDPITSAIRIYRFSPQSALLLHLELRYCELQARTTEV
jgi:CheY-like chemotaxis protein